jgi:hypothetical protein
MKIKKNGKVINLTESDLRRIVKKVIKEQDEAPVADVTKGDKKNWKFTVKSANPNVKGFDSEVLITMTRMKDPKTKKLGKPVYTVETRKEGGQPVYIGKIGIGANGVNFKGSDKQKLKYNVGAYTTGKYTGTDSTVAKTLTKGFKDSIGLDINFADTK